MSREVEILKLSSFVLRGAELQDLQTTTTRVLVTVEDEGEVSRVIERIGDGKEHSYGREKLRAELGESAWMALLESIGATS